MSSGSRCALERFVEGDPSAFGEIVERHQAALLRFATGLLGDRDLAQDVVQETFIRLMKNARTIGGEGKLSSWLFKTCRNAAIDYIRKERSVERLERRSSMNRTVEGNPVEGIAEKRDLARFVKERMRKLTEKERECILLKLVEGKSYKEISHITGLSVSNVGFQIHNGLKRLSAFVGGKRS